MGRDHRYITDIPYAARMFPRQSPQMIATVCLANGVAPPAMGEGFTYCDLGCGHGVGVNGFAACFPQGSFWGVDLMPEHIASARAQARAAGLENAHFIESDFASLDLDALPDFDFITLNGVFSWVPQEVREEIARLVEAKLRPGGALYVSFNAMPGWGELQPLREVLVHHLRGRDELSAAGRVAEGLRYLAHLRANHAPCFEQSPGSSALLDRMLGEDVGYLAHDYFNAVWDPLYFEDVAAMFEGAGATFVGSIPLYLNELDLVAPERFQSSLETAPDRRRRETHLDIFCNQTFRNDVFVREPAPRLDGPGLEAALMEVRYGAWVRRSALAEPIVFPHRDVRFDPAISEPIADLLSRRAGTLSELHAELPDTIGFEHLFSFLFLSLMEGRVMPFVTSTAPASGLDATHFRAVGGFNRAQLSSFTPAHREIFLTSQAMGNALVLTGLEAGLLRGLIEAGREGAAAWFADWLGAHGARLELADGLVDEAAVEREVEARIERFLKERLGKLLELGAIEAVDD